MAINPRKIKKRPAKDLKPGDLRSQVLEKGKPTPAKDLRSTDPKSLRNKALREANRAANENKPRPAKDIKAGGSRAQFLKDAKAGTIKAKGPSVGARVGRGLLKKLPVVGAAAGFIADAAPVGEGSTKDKYSTLKKKYSSPIGPKQPEGAKKSVVSSTTGSGRPEYPSSNKMKSGSSDIRKTASGTYTKSYDVKTKKSSSASTAATSAAASNGRKRPSTRYQRNELAMEQRNRSSSGQRKSILSLFRKG